MILIKKYALKILLLLVISGSNAMSVYAVDDDKEINLEEDDITENKVVLAKELHAQLNNIYKRNEFLNYKLTEKNKSLKDILSSLQLLNDKLDYKIKSRPVSADKTLVTMADFNTTDDDLIRKCDEIVDNFYSRKATQENSYVQDLFNNGQNDPQWERETEDQLHNFIESNNLTQSEFFDIQCSDSVCKMRVKHASSQDSQQFRYKLGDDSRFDVYESNNKMDPVTGGIITSFTILKDGKQVRKFIWGG